MTAGLTPSFLSFRVRKGLCAGPGALGTKIEYLSVWIFLSWQWTYSGRGTSTRFFFFLCFSKNHIQWGEQSCGEDFSALCFFFPRQAQVRQTFPLNCPLCWHLVPLPPPASRLFAWPPTKSHKHPLSSIVGLITETSHTVIWRDIWFKHPHSRNIIIVSGKIGACSMSVTWNKLPVPSLLLQMLSSKDYSPWFCHPQVPNPLEWLRERVEGRGPPRLATSGYAKHSLSRGNKMCH